MNGRITCKVNSLQEFLDCIFKITNIEKEFDTLRNYFYFRGQADLKWKILPSIGRNRTSVLCKGILDEEENLIAAAKFKLPNVFKEDMLPLDLLATLQHYGIPTRLLDVTTNPLVALYFACYSEKEKDGEVIVFHKELCTIANYPMTQAICESYKFAKNITPLNLFYKDIIEQNYFCEQKAIILTPTEGADWIKSSCKNLRIVSAKTNLDRQRLQQGAYILFNNKIVKQNEIFAFNKIIEPIPKDHADIKQIITIPKDKKETILKHLRKIGISEETLFADNIDLVCKNIANNFST